MGAAGCVAQTLALTTCPVPPALSRSTPGDKVHARGAPNSRGPPGGLWSNLGFLFVCSFVCFCFCSYLGVLWFLSSWRGGRAGVFLGQPASPSLTSRPAALRPPHAEPRQRGARGTPGVVVHRGARGGSRKPGRRERGEAEALRRKGPSSLGFGGRLLPMSQNFPGAEGRGFSLLSQRRFSSHQHFLWITPLKL